MSKVNNTSSRLLNSVEARSICLWLLLSLVVLQTKAQTINLDFPANAGIKTVVMLRQGIKTDTIFHDFLDAQGKAKIVVPTAYGNYRGLAYVVPNRPGAGYEFIVAEKNVTLHCDGIYPYAETVTFEHSPENEAMDSWYREQSMRQQKQGLLSELLQLYSAKEKLHTSLMDEKTALEREQVNFEQEIQQSKLYAAQLLGFHNFVQQRIAPLAVADSLQMAQTRQYLTDSIDVETLYSSGQWFAVINGATVLYDKGASYQHEFVNDMSKLLLRASDKVYATLADNLFSICEANGWEEQEQELARFLIDDGRIKHPTGKLQQLLTLYDLSNGSSVPALTQCTLPAGKVLLVFYKSGCGPCEQEMEQLKAQYEQIKGKGYEIITIAADASSEEYSNTAASFPWQHKYCDFKGQSGPDFLSFGVTGTPTLYVIDNGKLQGRYASLKEASL